MQGLAKTNIFTVPVMQTCSLIQEEINVFITENRFAPNFSPLFLSLT